MTAPVYEPWIDLRATVCILDPRLLLDEQSLANENFRDQLASADIIIANKTDRATAQSDAALQQWWRQYGGDRLLVRAEHGRIDGKLLDLPRQNLAELPTSTAHAHAHASKKGSPRSIFPRTNAGDAASIMVRAIRPAAGFSMPIPCLTPLDSSNGRVWRQ